MSFEAFYRPCPNFPERFISPKELSDFLQSNLSDSISLLGHSTEGRPIYKFQKGHGKVRVVAWSQMHGNESNATHALLDMLYTLEELPQLEEDLFSRITLDFVVMLNPDGSERWSRLNSKGIDLNRDFHKMESEEIKILKSLVLEGNYHYALNLHEQRTIFTTDGVHPATLSFLSPSEDAERGITKGRKKLMAVVAHLNRMLSPLLPSRIARYTDEFYPNSTGDNFTKLGIPTLLFEGGHTEEDYFRKDTRKFYTVALYYALELMAELKGSIEGFEEYFDLPENKESHYDIIYRNVELNTKFPCVLDIAVQLKEVKDPEKREIEWEKVVAAVGDLKDKKGWKEIDCTSFRFVSKTLYPKLDEIVDFEFVEK